MTQAISMRKDFLSVLDFEPADLERCLEVAAQLKADRALGRQAPTSDLLNGRHVALLFDKPSLRTRTTFEIAIRELGGHLIVLPPDVALGRREPVETWRETWSAGWTRWSFVPFRRTCCGSSRARHGGCTS